jgi:hypothetical protein
LALPPTHFRNGEAGLRVSVLATLRIEIATAAFVGMAMETVVRG